MWEGNLNRVNAARRIMKDKYIFLFSKNTKKLMMELISEILEELGNKKKQKIFRPSI